MKRLLVTSLVALVLLIAPSAYALTFQYDTTIDSLGIQDNLAHFTIVGSFTLTCPYGAVYVDLTSIGGRSAYAMLLASKLKGSPLRQIAYQIETKPVLAGLSLCYLVNVELQD